MTATVIPMRRCRRCGSAGEPHELTFRGEHVADFYACVACMADVSINLDRVRPVFEAMLAAGIEREAASDVMTFLLERAGL